MGASVLEEQNNLNNARFPENGIMSKQIERLSGVALMLSDAYNTVGGKKAASKFNAYRQDLEAVSGIESIIGEIQSSVGKITVEIESHDIEVR